jgi:hypothetical protein
MEADRLADNIRSNLDRHVTLDLGEGLATHADHRSFRQLQSHRDERGLSNRQPTIALTRCRISRSEPPGHEVRRSCCVFPLGRVFRRLGGDGRDTIHRGPGNDTVYADGEDIIARDCEHIHHNT